jgi:hypothetical protein
MKPRTSKYPKTYVMYNKLRFLCFLCWYNYVLFGKLLDQFFFLSFLLVVARFECLRLALSALSTAFLCSLFYFYLFPLFFSVLYAELLILSLYSYVNSSISSNIPKHLFFFNVPHVVKFGEYISTAHNIKVEFLTFFYYYISLHRNHPKSSSSIYPLTHRYQSNIQFFFLFLNFGTQ